MIVAIMVLAILSCGGLVFVFAGDNGNSVKRVKAIAKSTAGGRGAKDPMENMAQKRKNVAVLLKDVEKNQAAARKKDRPTLRRRLEHAGFPNATPRAYWTVSGLLGLSVAAVCFFTRQSWLVIGLAAFGTTFGLPRWVLGFLTARRRKKFTAAFAGAIDVIVRSVRSGLPTNEALRIVARESPPAVGSEFGRLIESLKVGVTLEQGLKRMHESMPTPEVGFFTIVMTIQAKSGGNLSEALNNLAAVLRDRKRLQGKVKAMSSEANASAMIIGSLPPGVMGLVYLTTPAYISLLFTERAGNLLLAGCVIWMAVGVFVMRKMINFKH